QRGVNGNLVCNETGHFGRPQGSPLQLGQPHRVAPYIIHYSLGQPHRVAPYIIHYSLFTKSIPAAEAVR
ncbi:MAG: hypothetical protein LBS16_06555, partial [Prevotellaceae bacterium]|nr:hypothetical protein [Prevotellaceae bacterium]